MNEVILVPGEVRSPPARPLSGPPCSLDGATAPGVAAAGARAVEPFGKGAPVYGDQHRLGKLASVRIAPTISNGCSDISVLSHAAVGDPHPGPSLA